MRSPRTRVLAVFAAACSVVSMTAADALAADNGRPVKVMTRNLYLGGDIGRPATAVGSLTGFPALVAFGNANYALSQIVEQTNFPERAKLLADEIDQREPDLIGLQEVATWRHGPLQLPPPLGAPGLFAVPNATVVDYDFLQILLGELEARGEHYKVVTNTTEADVEGPAFRGVPTTGSFVPDADHRLTMHDVILARDEGDIKIVDSGTANYSPAVQFQIPIAGVPFTFTRGYGWADVVVKKRAFRFINTHLESQFSIYALGQAAELLQGPAATTSDPVVLVCDCNSDPLNGSGKPPFDSTPHWAPYRLITNTFHFTDEWLLVHSAEEGFTSGLSETVDDADTSDIDHRIDMVFGRRPDGSAIPADRGWITGMTARTPDGLFASDHMGVVMRLKP